VTAADRRAVAEGYYVDTSDAEYVRDFFVKFLHHSKGRWAGQPFELLAWQWERIVLPLYGWKRPDGSRRFRMAYIEVAKKNGKSTLLSGLSLYHLIADGEAGAEVYTAAKDRKQASIIYNEAASMVRKSPSLFGRVMLTDSKKRMAFVETDSIYQALSADVESQEGLNASAIFFDELHSQKTRALWECLEFAGAAREQPLLVSITTAGVDRESICYEQRQIAERILDGTDDHTLEFLPVVFAAEPDDDTMSEATWYKANPSLGVTIDLEQFAEQARQAHAVPSKLNAWKRRRLDMWTESETAWFTIEDWAKCGDVVSELSLLGKPCYAGLDISSTKDITALVLAFPNDIEGYDLLCRFWIPKDAAHKREARDRVPYSAWERDGFVTMIPGNTIDQDFIRHEVNELNGKFDILNLGYDPWNATNLAKQLGDDGLELTQVRQGFVSLNEPSKIFESKLLDGKMRHGNHPVLSWMARNVSIGEDPAGNIKPLKPNGRNPYKIDGIVAAVIAVAVGMLAEPVVKSVYETRGIRTVG
jgi:phage terminase large subunit-like protein